MVTERPLPGGGIITLGGAVVERQFQMVKRQTQVPEPEGHSSPFRLNLTTETKTAFNSVQVKIHEGSPEGIRVTMEERICERDEF